MADFVAVLKKTIDGLGDTTPATRQKVYDKARATIAAKLAAISPPPAPAVVERQKRVLEDAIATVEAGYAAPAAAEDDPLAELENVFASLKSPQPRPAEPRNPPRPDPKADRRPEPQADKRPERKDDAWAKPPQAAQRPAAAIAAPPPPPPPSVESAPAVGVARDGDAPFTLRGDAPRPRRSHAALIAVGIVLAVVAGAGYGVWLNRDAFGSLFGGGSTEAAVTRPVVEQPAETPQQPAEQPVAAAEPVQNTDQPSPAAATDGAPKFTQRLMPDGSEVDEGGGTGGTGVGEGTSVAAVTQLPGAPGSETPPAADAMPQAPAVGAPQAPSAPAQEQRQTVAVGQRAIFYEERTNAAEGSAELGNVVWSLVQESPGANQPAEPAIRAEATIPGKDLQLRMTIRRNADQSLPASHIVEMIFLTPEGFGGGGIDNILRVALKGSEQEAGNPLLGIPAKIADGFFLVALMDGKAEQEANLGLMRRQSWIDIPVVYKTGRRALITMEKGIPGEKVFQDAIDAWQAATASAG
jgi:hypothetical protein